MLQVSRAQATAGHGRPRVLQPRPLEEPRPPSHLTVVGRGERVWRPWVGSHSGHDHERRGEGAGKTRRPGEDLQCLGFVGLRPNEERVESNGGYSSYMVPGGHAREGHQEFTLQPGFRVRVGYRNKSPLSKVPALSLRYVNTADSLALSSPISRVVVWSSR